MNSNDLITVKRIAEYCLVNPTTVRRWVKDGKLSCMKLPSGYCRVTVKEFVDFLERHEMPIKEELRLGKQGL
jgi:two-component system, OmpR family, response regulator VicR